MTQLFTTLGPIGRDQLGIILPHEHVFVDLRTPDQPGHAQADATDVIALMAPEIERLKAVGVSALVECATGGVGVRPDLDLAVSLATDFPIVVPTGIYREPWIPDWARDATESELRDWMLRDLTEGFSSAAFRAGWIKLSAGDAGVTPLERRILRGAAAAALETGAVIGSHTIAGDVVLDQLDTIEEVGGSASRFIWIHAQQEPDFALHRAVAQRGAWIEYDHIGRVDDEVAVDMIIRALDAGLGEQLLLSHDAGWYDPALPGGGTPQPYTHLSSSLLPRLRERGLDDRTIVQLTHTNPFTAFAR